MYVPITYPYESYYFLIYNSLIASSQTEHHGFEPGFASLSFSEFMCELYPLFREGKHSEETRTRL